MGELENVDETRLRIRTPDGAREVPVGALLAIELRSPRLPETEDARRLAGQLAPLLEVGIAGELARVADLEAWLEARVRELVEPARLGAWDGWPRWPVLSQRGEVTGAPGLDALVPGVAHAARELAARGERARGALRLLRAIDTPAARGLLIGLWLDPRFWEPALAVDLVPLLVDLDDPRLARVTRARVRRSWEGPIPELAREQLPLLLRHGGLEVQEAVLRQLTSAGPEALTAWAALRFARDRRALEMVMSAFCWTHLRLPDEDPRVVETLAGLVESFGAPAAARLLETVRNLDLPVARRTMAAAALARACPAERVPVTALLAVVTDATAPGPLAEVVRGLATRTDLELAPAALERLQSGALFLVGTSDEGLRRAGAEAIGGCVGLHTEAVRAALRRALREHAAAEAELARALAAVERTLDAAEAAGGQGGASGLGR
ncbi:MAG: hypothetical protein M9894_33200 [Planctomycetes bacterium]|nr:hypothetical protein [Planctomycetota bacterium]